MIAIVSSTIAPSSVPSHDGERSNIPPATRLMHTKETIASLLAMGVQRIYLADNSPGTWVRERAAELAPAQLLFFEHPPIRNKSIGEIWLLLGALESLPENEPILKISGRYRIGVDTALRLREGDDVVGRVYRHGRNHTLSTRCYLMRNRAVAAQLWERTVDEIYADAARIHGPRSLWRIVRNSLNPSGDSLRYSDPGISLETATYRAIRNLSLQLNRVDYLAVQGIIGKWGNEAISE
jgi:hypothetical protein